MGFDGGFIERDKLKGRCWGDSKEIGRDSVVGGVSYVVGENVGFEEIE